MFLSFLGFFLWRGMSRGFLGSLIGPVAFLAASIAAVVYYNATKNVPVSLAIGVLGPFLLQYLLGILLHLLSSKPGGESRPSLISSMLGGLVNSVWGMCFILPIIITLALIAPMVPALATVERDVQDSRTYGLIKPWLNKFLPLPAKVDKSASPAGGPSASPGAPPAAVQALAEDARMQDLFNDPDVVKAIEEKNFAALMGNPKILAMAQDPDMVKKILAAYAQMER